MIRLYLLYIYIYPRVFSLASQSDVVIYGDIGWLVDIWWCLGLELELNVISFLLEDRILEKLEKSLMN
jgi:hypothetical protein